MPSVKLKKQPLVEAICEIRWGELPLPGTTRIDPHYKVLVGRFYDRVMAEYPEYEQLPSAELPEGIAWGVVQHRFRCGPNDWPLLQVGPGIMTVNDTHKYLWEDFYQRTQKAVEVLHTAYPKPDELKISSLILRYIDAVDLEVDEQDILSFLNEKMKVKIELPKNLFEKSIILPNAFQLNWRSAFQCSDPKGNVTLSFAKGQKEGQPALIWETIVHSQGDDLPPMPSGFEKWIQSAHSITHDWFFKLINGPLERKFNDEN